MQQTSTKVINDLVWLSRNSSPLGIVQETKIWQLWQNVYLLTKIFPKNELQKDYPGQKTRRLVLINKKKSTSNLAKFAVPMDHWVNMKENKKINKYLNLARETKIKIGNLTIR